MKFDPVLSHPSFRGCKHPQALGKGDWLFAIATIIIKLTLPTLTVCFGMVYAAFLQSGDKTNLEVSFIIGLFIAVFNISGIPSAYLNLRHNPSNIIFIGILLTSFGVAMCCLSLNTYWLILWYSMIAGAGSSLASHATFLITENYLRNQRIGVHLIASFGSTLSFFVMPLVVYAIIIYFTLRGAFLIWSAIILQGLIGATIYKIHRCKKPQENNAKFDNKTILTDHSKTIPNGCHHQISTPIPTGLRTVPQWHSNLNHAGDVDNDSLRSVPQGSEFEDAVSEHFFDASSVDGRRSSFMSATSVESFKTAKSMYKSVETMFVSIDNIDSAFSVVKENGNTEFISDRKVETNGITNQNSEHPNGVVPTKPSQCTPDSNATICDQKIPKLKDLIALKPIKDHVFFIYGLASAINIQLHLSYVVYLPTLVLSVDNRDKLPVLLATLASSEFLAKIAIAILAEKITIQDGHLCIFVSFLNSLSFLILLLSSHILWIGASAFLIGLSIGISSSINPRALLKHFSPQAFSHSNGLVLILSGFFSAVLYPIQGQILDASHSFAILSILLLCLALIPLILWSVVAPFLPSQKQEVQSEVK